MQRLERLNLATVQIWIPVRIPKWLLLPSNPALRYGDIFPFP